MTTPDDVALIAEYERLRHEADQLNQRSEQVDARLVELERLLPDSYTYPGDRQPSLVPQSWRPCPPAALPDVTHYGQPRELGRESGEGFPFAEENAFRVFRLRGK